MNCFTDDPQDPPIKTIDQASRQPSHSFPWWKSPADTTSHSLNRHKTPPSLPRGNPSGVMDMVIFRTIFFELLVFFMFTLFTLHFAY